MRVDPEGPEGVVEVEDHEAREGQAVAEGGGCVCAEADGCSSCAVGRRGGGGCVGDEGGRGRGFGQLFGHCCGVRGGFGGGCWIDVCGILLTVGGLGKNRR